MTVSRLGVSGNQPAEIGDNTQQIDNREIVIITLEMVTSSLIPPYNDPEGDLLDAIRIVEISAANKGAMSLNGIPVAENDIITREQLEDELLIYAAPSIDDLWADSFRFQGRDEGSGIWVD